MRLAEFEARLNAMALLGLLSDREVEVLLALRRNDAAVLSRVLTECLATLMKVEAPEKAAKTSKSRKRGSGRASPG